MEINKLRSIIKEAIKDVHLKEIEAVAENAAMEARLAEYDKAIKMCEYKIEMAESLEEMQDVIDENKIKDIKNKLKNLQKEKGKLEKAKAKKNKGKEVVTDKPVDETYVEEDSMNNAIDPKMGYTMEEESQEEALNESFLKMQKLAGVITEAQYNEAFDDIAMKFSNTAPNTPPGATAGTAPKKEDTNVKTIMTRLKPLLSQLRANDTTNEFFDLLKSMIDLIQSINKDALSDTEVVMGLNNLLIAKRKEINAPKK